MTAVADQSGEGRPAAGAVNHFYHVVFPSERSFRLWSDRIVEFTGALREIVPARPEMRPVIFVPVRLTPGEPPYAYVSLGARGLGALVSGGAMVDPAPLTAAELPRGLTMLFGEAVDAGEYVKRHA